MNSGKHRRVADMSFGDITDICDDVQRDKKNHELTRQRSESERRLRIKDPSFTEKLHRRIQDVKATIGSLKRRGDW